uniref:Putative rhamnogalacturonate lyase B isoform X2 n=1 Tax=Rhizophora mucronata TaxID=61149 RepID=A0A2P2JXE0_RHIMU
MHIQFVHQSRIRIWHKVLSSRAVRNAYFPKGRTISWWIVCKETQFNSRSWFYGDINTVFVIANDTRDPCI